MAPDEKQPQTIDAETGIAEDSPPARRRIDLSSLRDVRLEIAAVYRAEDAGELETYRATRKVWILRQLADIIAQTDLERRIQDLEDWSASPDGKRALPAPGERTLN